MVIIKNFINFIGKSGIITKTIGLSLVKKVITIKNVIMVNITDVGNNLKVNL